MRDINLEKYDNETWQWDVKSFPYYKNIFHSENINIWNKLLYLLRIKTHIAFKNKTIDFILWMNWTVHIASSVIICKLFFSFNDWPKNGIKLQMETK